MSNVTNIQWQNLNSTRAYPIDDGKTLVDVDNKILPEGLLSDLNMWVPDDLVDEVFLGSLTVSTRLVSGAFQGNLGGQPVPLAAFTINRAAPYGQIPLKPLADGVGGYISLGAKVNDVETSHYRFTSADATGISPRAVKFYPAAGVSNIKRADGATLNGEIEFRTNTPNTLRIEKQVIWVDGVEKDAIVFGLNRQEAGAEVWGQFVGPCGGHPDSNTCKKSVITAINDVTPDENGEITLTISETVVPSLGVLLEVLTAQGQVTVNYGLGIGQVCGDADDFFPNDQVDKCDPGGGGLFT